MPYLRKATDNPMGFMPTEPVLSMRGFRKDASAAAIAPGDVVIMEADGAIAVAAASSPNIVGVAAQFSTASTADTVLVYDHPDQIYMVQDDSDTTQMAATEEGTNVDLVVTTYNTTTGRSAHEIDSSTAAVGATLAVKVLRLHPIEEDSFATAAGQQRKWLVKFNAHLFGGAENVGI